MIANSRCGRRKGSVAKPCKDGNTNICVAEGCYAQACIEEKKWPVVRTLDEIRRSRPSLEN